MLKPIPRKAPLSRFSRLRKEVASWLTKKQNTNENSPDEDDERKTESEREKAIREDKEEFRKLFEIFKSQTSLNVDAGELANAINNFQLYEMWQFQAQGYNDGLRGVKDRNIDASAAVRATFIIEHANAILAGKIQGLESELTLCASQIMDMDIDLAVEKRFNHETGYMDKREHRNFSKPTALFYIVVGFMLMFADFPISLNIAKYFIDLPIGFEETFLNKVTHPEILLFSLGITFLSVYYKIIWDEFVNVSIFPDVAVPETAKHKTFLAYLRVLFKLVILVFLVYLFYNIGSARNALNTLSAESLHPDFVSNENVFRFKLISFIGTTVLIPFISGICLSVGFAVLSNSNNLNASNRRLLRLKEEKNEAEKSKTTTETVKNMLLSLQQKWVDEPVKVAALTKLFKNAYDKSQKQGQKTQYGDDVYRNAEALFFDAINSQN